MEAMARKSRPSSMATRIVLRRSRPELEHPVAPKTDREYEQGRIANNSPV
jgi:hypothetical protein